MEEHRLQCEDCKYRLPDEIINGKLDSGATCIYCKKYPDINNPKPTGIVDAKFDFLKDPLDETGFYINCEEYQQEKKRVTKKQKDGNDK